MSVSIQDSKEEEQIRSQEPQSKKKILIVEDECEVRSLLMSRAEKYCGYDCRWDAEGNEVVSLCLSFKPDLVLLDMNLPKAHGLDIIKQIRAHGELQNLPVIVFSASGQRELVDKAMNSGASLYFTKGGSISDLFDVVDEFLAA